MELIQTDTSGKELGNIMKANIDFEVGEEKDSINDFEVEFKRYYWTGDVKMGCRIFSPNTEFGGVVSQIDTDTGANTITVKGYTWRGMMKKKIIQPEYGQDYYKVSGEINTIVGGLVKKSFPGLFYGTEIDTGIHLNFQFERYCNLHDGIVKMLKTVGYRLDIRYIQGERDEAGYVQVQAVQIVDYSEEYEMSNDNNMTFRMIDNQRGINHLICLGKGELKERVVVHLYVDEKGKIGTEQYYKGTAEITEVYDSNGSEEEELIKNGTKKLEESKNKTEYNMTMKKIEGNIDIGDIVGGRNYLLNISIKKPIGRKIWAIAEGKETLEYKLEGDA